MGTDATTDRPSGGSLRLQLDGQVRNGESGATIAEYALLIVLIAVPVSVFLPTLGVSLNAIFQQLVAAF